MRDNDILILILVIFALISVFFGHLGLGFHGEIKQPDIDTSHAPGFFDVVGWAWNGIGFIFGMMLFQVDGVAPWENMIFIIMGLLLLWIFLKWLRGSNQGV